MNQTAFMEQGVAIVLAHLTSTQRRAYVLADNKLALNAGWDLEMLSLEPTLRPRREVLPPSESTHARDHATLSEDPCGPICGSRGKF